MVYPLPFKNIGQLNFDIIQQRQAIFDNYAVTDEATLYEIISKEDKGKFDKLKSEYEYMQQYKDYF